jgi:hypothetical protein
VAGLQHPAPSLLAMVHRDDKRLRVSAPFARAIYKGRNVTSDPPRTSLWCLLYAQVKQADGLDWRNILLDEIRLERRPISRHVQTFKERIAKAGKNRVLVQQLKLEMTQVMTVEKEAVWQAYSGWDNKEIAELLYLYGLPSDSPLSVLCVEVYGQITNIHQHIDDIDNKKQQLIDSVARHYDQVLAEGMRQEHLKKLKPEDAVPATPDIDPLRSQLGLFRILRTSPLVEVPFVCCTECD